jgi:hypothetical protein
MIAILKAKQGQTVEELQKRWVEQHALVGAGFKNPGDTGDLCRESGNVLGQL